MALDSEEVHHLKAERPANAITHINLNEQSSAKVSQQTASKKANKPLSKLPFVLNAAAKTFIPKSIANTALAGALPICGTLTHDPSFSGLPTELREIIWIYTAQDPRIVDAYYHAVQGVVRGTLLLGSLHESTDAGWSSPTPCPVLLHVVG